MSPRQGPSQCLHPGSCVCPATQAGSLLKGACLRASSSFSSSSSSSSSFHPPRFFNWRCAPKHFSTRCPRSGLIPNAHLQWSHCFQNARLGSSTLPPALCCAHDPCFQGRQAGIGVFGLFPKSQGLRLPADSQVRPSQSFSAKHDRDRSMLRQCCRRSVPSIRLSPCLVPSCLACLRVQACLHQHLACTIHSSGSRNLLGRCKLLLEPAMPCLVVGQCPPMHLLPPPTCLLKVAPASSRNPPVPSWASNLRLDDRGLPSSGWGASFQLSCPTSSPPGTPVLPRHP